MVCIRVEINMEERLYLSNAPNFQYLVMISGFILGLAVAFCCGESLTWKGLCVTGIMLGISWIGDWEECAFNKSKGQISLKRYSVWDLFLYPLIDNRYIVIAKIEDVTEVNVKEDLFLWGTTYEIVLQFKTGMSLPITKFYTFGLSNVHEEIAQKIRSFLALDSTTKVSSQDDAYMGDNSSAEEEEFEDDFEVIAEDEISDWISDN